MPSITELKAYFSKKNNGFTNNEGIEIIYLDNSVYTNLSIQDYAEFEISIGTEDENLEEFIKGFEIHSLTELDCLGYKDLWIRYLNREADIYITPLELEATLIFRLHKNRTMVLSLDLHFYDEINEHLTLPQDFIQYVAANERSLNLASLNRYKF